MLNLICDNAILASKYQNSHKTKVENKKDRNMLKLVICLKIDGISIIFDVN